jgi:hypothetical protein
MTLTKTLADFAIVGTPVKKKQRQYEEISIPKVLKG